jgi:hypothetical protein
MIETLAIVAALVIIGALLWWFGRVDADWQIATDDKLRDLTSRVAALHVELQDAARRADKMSSDLGNVKKRVASRPRQRKIKDA